MSCKRQRKTSPIWEYFEEVATDISLAKCKTCSKEVKRGKGTSGKTLNTSALWDHLEVYHKEEHTLAKEMKESQENENKKKKMVSKLSNFMQ